MQRRRPHPAARVLAQDVQHEVLDEVEVNVVRVQLRESLRAPRVSPSRRTCGSSAWRAGSETCGSLADREDTAAMRSSTSGSMSRTRVAAAHGRTWIEAPARGAPGLVAHFVNGVLEEQLLPDEGRGGLAPHE